MKRADVERFKLVTAFQAACFMTACCRAFIAKIMNPQDKAKELSNYFCSPCDVFHPNVASIRNAIKCCEQMIKEHEEEILESNDVNRINYWHEVIAALNAL